MSRVVLAGDAARREVKKGIDLVANTVKITLGPRGRNVILDTDEFRPPLITNDGVTIAREITGATPYEKIGARLIKDVAEKTNDVAGDGTTTATLLTQAIITRSLQLVDAEADAVSIRKGIENAAADIVAQLEAQKVETSDVESLTAVATISCGDPKLGAIIAEAVHKVGAEGIITLEDNEEEGTDYKVSEGLELRGGIQLNVFVTNPATQEAVLDNVPVFVTDHEVTNSIEVVKMMEICASKGHKSCVLIANNITGEAMATCVVNRAQGKFNLTPIRVVAWGDQGQGVLRDAAAATDAHFFSKDEGALLPSNMENHYDWELFGMADRIIITKDKTTILGGQGDRESRIKELEAQASNAKRAFEKEQIMERVARLRSGVGVIRVGGVTEGEREERRLRVEDAVNATKAALKSGIVSGGGAALYRASVRALELADGPVEDGYGAVLKACQAPLRQMALNSSFDLDAGDLEKLVKNEKMTIDFRTGKLVDGIKEGVIDPLLVVVAAIKNSASTAALFITSEAAVANEIEKKPNLAA